MAYTGWTREQLVAELRKRDAAADALPSSINLLETIHLAQTDFMTVDSETNIFHGMLANFLKITDSEYGFIDELFYNDDGTMYLEARSITNIAWDDASRALYAKLVSGEIKFDNLKSLFGEVMVTGKPVISLDAPTDPRRTGIPPGHPALTTFLGLPLYAAGEFVGVIGLANGSAFDEALIERLEPLTRICAIIMRSLKIDRRRAEAIAELETRTAELELSNEELETFAYVASHDLQTPLRSITGFLQLLRESYAGELDERAHKWIDRVVQATDRMHLLIGDLLAYSRVGSRPIHLVPVPMDEVVDDILESLSVVVKESGAEIVCDPLPIVAGDMVQLQQLMQNLVGNALKYRGDRTPQVRVSAQRSDGGWTLSVADNGIGIASRHQEQVFEVFKRLHTQSAYAGTGIGLAICRRVVQRLGGRIWLESEEGVGTTFHFTLPEVAAEK